MFEKTKQQLMEERFIKETINKEKKALEVVKYSGLSAIDLIHRELSDCIRSIDRVYFYNFDASCTVSISFFGKDSQSRFLKVKEIIEKNHLAKYGNVSVDVLDSGEDIIARCNGVVYRNKSRDKITINLWLKKFDKCEVEYVEETKKVAKLKGACAEMMGITE